MTIYAVYDKKGDGVVNLVTAKTDGVACRNASMMCKEGSPYNLYAEDYELVSLAVVNTDTCEVIPDKRHICDFTALING